MSDLHFQGAWRMDWGFDNLSETSTFIATLMIAVWGLAYVRNWGFWVAIVAFNGLGICLNHTLSRGGFIALCAGLIPVIATAPRPWPRKRLLALGAVASIIIVEAFFLNVHLRYEQRLIRKDQSITNRFQLWKIAPQMMVDAPGGWGFGKSGAAYREWYEPLTQNQSYRNLDNSHLTWLVEMGWPFRLDYILGWGCIFLLSWPGCRIPGWFAVPLGVWIAFAVAASFSSVAECPQLWIIPGISLLAVIGYRLLHDEWLSEILWLIPPGTSFMLGGLLYLAGAIHSSGIHCQGNTIFLGSIHPKIWVLPDSETLGKDLGRAVRSTMQKEALCTSPISVGIMVDTTHCPTLQGERAIVIGNPLPIRKLQKVFEEAGSIELVNPGFYPQEVGMATSPKPKQPHPPVELMISVLPETTTEEAWKNFAPFQVLKGVGENIQDWTPIFRVAANSPTHIPAN